jgi:hypothetical protein
VSTAGILALPTNLQYKYGEHENTHEYRHGHRNFRMPSALSSKNEIAPNRFAVTQVFGVLKAYWEFKRAYSSTKEFGPGDGALKVFQNSVAVAGNVTKQK